LAASVALVALVASSCSSGSGSKSVDRGATIPPTSVPLVTAPAVAGRVNWSDCGGGFQCGSLLVPLDYSGKVAGTIALAVIRLPAADHAHRIGSLLINPGGPGAPGIAFARRAKTFIGASVRARFDVIGFDPRGVGQSEGVNCASGPDVDALLQLDFAPGTEAERLALAAGVKTFDEGCQRGSGRVLPFVSTRDAAHDMDLIRQAVGDEKLTYLGLSYGTLLGAMYASEFPTRVRALALDGALDPAATFDDVNRLQAQGFEQQLHAFLDDCAARPSCRFDTGGDPLGAVSRLLTQVDQAPLPATRVAGNRKLNHSLALLGIVTGLYSRARLWPRLETGLADAQRGDGSTLMQLADTYTERHDDGSYDGILGANAAVSCIDQPTPRDPNAYETAARALEQVAPTLGRVTEYLSLLCAFWPVPAQGTGGSLSAPGAPPILVVGTTHDPATPYVWAQNMARQLGTGVLLTRDGDGHTAYGGGNRCIDRAVDAYLIDLVLPRPGTRC
jgi:pimeloyl-ACP methyl ester carboxylesterase